MRYDLLFFDLDGTLADTADDIAASLQGVLAEEKLPVVSREKVVSSVGDGVRKLIERCLQEGPDSMREKVLALFLDRYAGHLLDQTKLYPGVPETLSLLRGCNKALLSNKPEGLCQAILRGTEIEGHFDVLIGGDTFPVRKPDPASVLQTCRRFRIPLHRALLIGDSRVDQATARSAGIRFCAVTYGYHQPGDLDGADHSVDQFPQLMRVVEGVSEVVDR